MFKYTIPILCLLVALGLSICTGYISVIGLMFIFSGIWIPFALIELAKLVTTVVLHKHWNHGFGLVKFGLILTVVLSMLVTSIGVFGYLSKASTQGKEEVTVNSSKLESLELNVDRKQASMDRNIQQIDKYNDMLSRLITDNPTKAQRERKSIQSSIKELEKENKTISVELDKLNDELIPYKKQISKHEVEIGPLLYVTKLMYGEDYKSHSEEALTYLIITFMFILDPFAIMLLIASQKSFEKISGKRIRKIQIKKKEYNDIKEEVKSEVPDEFGIPVPVNVFPETRKSYKVGRARRRP